MPDLPGSGNLNNLGVMVVDGEQAEQANVPYEISCRVRGSGAIDIEGSLAGPNASPFLSDPGSGTNISISGTIQPDGLGNGQVSFFTTATLAVSPKENTSCSLQATPSPRKACSNLTCLNGEMPTDYGSIVVTFNCTDMNMGAAGIAADCEADGTIVLDRCTY